MNESYSAWKERRRRKTEIWVKLKQKYITQISSYVIKMASKRDRLSETERFIELWQAEESLWNLLCRSSRSQMSFKISVLKKFAIFTTKHLCWGLFLTAFKPEGVQLYLKMTPTEHRCFPLSSFFYRTALMVASNYQTNIRSGKKRKKVLEEYQKEKIFFMYKYLFISCSLQIIIISNAFLKHIRQISSISWKV